MYAGCELRIQSVVKAVASDVLQRHIETLKEPALEVELEDQEEEERVCSGLLRQRESSG